MSRLKTKLIHLGHQDPSLRKHLRPILDRLTKNSTLRLKRQKVKKRIVDEMLELAQEGRGKDVEELAAKELDLINVGEERWDLFLQDVKWNAPDNLRQVIKDINTLYSEIDEW